jgi:hypothetical protein
MKLIKINFIRCGEIDCSNFMFAPDDWEKKDIDEAIRGAKKEYLAAVEQALKAKLDPPNSWKDYHDPPYKDFPDLTVGQIDQHWEEMGEAYRKWEKNNRPLKSSFEDFLGKWGLKNLYAIPEEDEYDVDWGHRHGVKLMYSGYFGENKFQITPLQLVEAVKNMIEEEDD